MTALNIPYAVAWVSLLPAYTVPLNGIGLGWQGLGGGRACRHLSPRALLPSGYALPMYRTNR